MKWYKLMILASLSLAALEVQGQGYFFGFKGGLTAGIQRWDQSFQRDPLYRYHAVIFTESYTEEDRNALFAQLGYHVKGSAIRTYRTTVQLPTGAFVDIPAREIPFEFKNLSLSIGGKQKFATGQNTKFFYLLGIRGDYTLATNLRPASLDPWDVYGAILPFEEFVNKFNFGAIAGAGFQFSISELIGAVLEFTANPDFTKQYRQPEIPNLINPNPDFGGSTFTIPERQISNTTFEITLGLRFLRKIIYID
jgi:hypothetical protein